jgi:hypothetical protein
MTMEFCRFRDFGVPVLGLSTSDPSIHEMHATRLVDSSFPAPHFPDAAGTRLLLKADDFTIYSGQIRAARGGYFRRNEDRLSARLTFTRRYVRLNSDACGTPSTRLGATEYGDT